MCIKDMLFVVSLPFKMLVAALQNVYLSLVSGIIVVRSVCGKLRVERADSGDQGCRPGS